MGNSGEKIFWSLLTLSTLVAVNCTNKMQFKLTTTWDSKPVNHDPIEIALFPEDDYIVMEMKAPFFNDPPAPDGESGKPFHKLWDYEVVEAFFLGKDEKYLEVEFSPHGQHLLLFLSGRKNAIKMCLPVEYHATINGNTWTGSAKIPKTYFPPGINLFNAYAIHGSDENRVYESLYPVPTNHFENPDFHRLEFFRYIDFSEMLPYNHPLSKVWTDALHDFQNGGELTCKQE